MVSNRFGMTVLAVAASFAAGAAGVGAQTGSGGSVGSGGGSGSGGGGGSSSGSYTFNPAEWRVQSCSNAAPVMAFKTSDGAGAVYSTNGTGIARVSTLSPASGDRATAEGSNVIIARAATADGNAAAPATAVFSSGTVREGQAVSIVRSKNATGESNVHIYQRDAAGNMVEMVPTTVDGKTQLVATTTDQTAEGRKYHVKRPPARLTEAQVAQMDGSMRAAKASMAAAGGAGGAVAAFSSSSTVTTDGQPTTCVITLRPSAGGGNW
jgi:hypothetical protein